MIRTFSVWLAMCFAASLTKPSADAADSLVLAREGKALFTIAYGEGQAHGAGTLRAGLGQALGAEFPVVSHGEVRSRATGS